MPEDMLLVGYADNGTALMAAHYVGLAQLKLNQIMRMINNWMANHGFQLALNKKQIGLIPQFRSEYKLMKSLPAAKYCRQGH